MRPYPLYLIILSAIILIQCGGNTTLSHNSCVHHNLYVKLLPEEQALLAKDTLQLDNTDNSDEFYFYLNRALSVDHIQVGNQNLDFEIVELEQNIQLNDSILYRIIFPKSLHPSTIHIWYQGTFTASSNDKQTEKICIIDQNSVDLDGGLCWYPRTLDDKSTFTVKAFITDNINLASNANFVFSEQCNDSTLYLWEQNEPIDQLDMYSMN